MTTQYPGNIVVKPGIKAKSTNDKVRFEPVRTGAQNFEPVRSGSSFTPNRPVPNRFATNRLASLHARVRVVLW